MTVDRHPYVCETCDEFVLLTQDQYDALRGEGLYGSRIICDACVAADPTNTPGPRPRTARAPHAGSVRKTPKPRVFDMPESTRLELNSSEREDYGVTITIRDQASGSLRTISEPGPVHRCLRALVAAIDAMEGEWLVVSISTPATIFRDLQGSMAIDYVRPEAKFLGLVGRTDLVERRWPPRRESERAA